MQPEPPPDVVSWGSRTIPRRVRWAVVAVLLAAALAIALAAHHHGRVVALRHEPRTRPHPAKSSLPVLTFSTVALPQGKKLNGTVKVISAAYPTGRAQLETTARITGGRPETAYTLIAFDCTGVSGYQSWAVGTTNSRGVGLLSGTSPVLLKDKFWLYLSPSSGNSNPGLLGTFSVTGRFSVAPAGNPACP